MRINKKMLTCEDANSIIKHFGKGFCDYYEIDTSDLTSPDYWFAFDFVDIYRAEDIIQFSINNSLWTKGFYISGSNIDDYTVAVEDDRITVTGDGLEWCVLVLELSPEFRYDDYVELDFKPVFLPVIRPFYENIPLRMAFVDKNDAGIAGLSVKDLITGETLTTRSGGLIDVTSAINHHGEFDYKLETKNSGETVDYNFPYIRVKTELPVRLVNDVVYRDKKNTLTFEFLYDDSYDITSDMLFTGNDLVLVVDNVEYEVTAIEGNQFSFNVPIRSRNELTMKLNIEGNEYVSMSSMEFNVPVSFVTCSNSLELKAELESDSPASVVVFAGESLDDEINISTDVLIRFSDLVESELDNVFTVKEDAVLSLSNCNFTGKTLITLENGECNIDNSTFTHCTRPILIGDGNATIKNSQFIDNITAINLNGDLNVLNTLFDISDLSYYETSTPAFISVYGDLDIDYCQFDIELDGLSSLGFGYLFALIGRNSLVNGVNASNLLQNEVFPVKKCTSDVSVESENYRISSKNNKSFIWTVSDTNTVFSNNLSVEYVGGE